MNRKDGRISKDIDKWLHIQNMAYAFESFSKACLALFYERREQTVIEYLKTTEHGMLKLELPERGCWINCIAPSLEEKNFLTEHIGVLPEFVKSSLDEEESSHIDYDDDLEQTLVIIDYPSMKEGDNGSKEYFTCPLGVVLMHGYIITISLYESWSINALRTHLGKMIDTRLKTRFLLTLCLYISQRYLICLREIDRLSTQTEQDLQEDLNNEGLLRLLGLEKSLVYFSTSLKSDETTLNRIHRGIQIKLYEEDEELWEDVMIEMNQANEMCNIYSGILVQMRETYNSISSNNMNEVMKVLTFVTIVLSMPNIVYAFYGMNVRLPLPYIWAPVLISIGLCVGALIWLLGSKRFK